jgi:Na+/phosphate symporter
LVKSRFDAEKAPDHKEEKLAFDLVRASVNLVVASILIALGTSLKLPLSTTYVTFMVAMGTSLADGAWGRESAVYRISGVLTVVGGWFFTAFIAFLASFIIASMIFFGKLPVILILLGLSVFILLRTHAFHRNKVEKQEKLDSEITTASHEVLKSIDDQVTSSIVKVSKILYLCYNSLSKEKHKELKKLRKESKHLNKDVKEIRENIHSTLKKFKETELESGHHYAHVVAYMIEMSNSLMHIVQPAFNHLDNNHPVDREQSDHLKEFNEKVGAFFDFVIHALKNKDFESLEDLSSRRDKLIDLANDIFRGRIKILKKTQKGGKVSATYLEMLMETKSLMSHLVQLVKAYSNLLESYTSANGIFEEEEVMD